MLLSVYLLVGALVVGKAAIIKEQLFANIFSIIHTSFEGKEKKNKYDFNG